MTLSHLQNQHHLGDSSTSKFDCQHKVQPWLPLEYNFGVLTLNKHFPVDFTSMMLTSSPRQPALSKQSKGIGLWGDRILTGSPRTWHTTTQGLVCTSETVTVRNRSTVAYVPQSLGWRKAAVLLASHGNLSSLCTFNIVFPLRSQV